MVNMEIHNVHHAIMWNEICKDVNVTEKWRVYGKVLNIDVVRRNNIHLSMIGEQAYEDTKPGRI